MRSLLPLAVAVAIFAIPGLSRAATTYTWNSQPFNSLAEAEAAMKLANASHGGDDLHLCGDPVTTTPGSTIYNYCVDLKEPAGPIRGGYWAGWQYGNSSFTCTPTATPASPNLLSGPYPPCHVASEQELLTKFTTWYYQAYASQCNLEDPTVKSAYTLPGNWSANPADPSEVIKDENNSGTGRAIHIRWKVRISPTQCETAYSENDVHIGRAYAYKCPSGYSVRNAPEVSWPRVCKAFPTNTQIIANDPPPASSCPRTGYPCVPATGEKILKENDFDWNGYTFTRTYRSLKAFENRARLGDRWWHGWMMRLTIPSSSATTVLRYSAQGDYEAFNQVAGSTTIYKPEASSRRYLEKQPDSSWVFVDDDGPNEIYDASGRLVAINDEQSPARSLVFSYDVSGRLSAVATGVGRVLLFTYQEGTYSDPINAQGWVGDRLLSIEDDAHVALATYSYDSAGRLASVQHADGTARTYVYGEADHICVDVTTGCGPAAFFGYVTGIVDETNTRLSNYYFDHYGRVTQSVHAGGAHDTQLSYVASNQTVVTRPGEPTLTYTFGTDMYRRALSIQSSAGTETYQYDPAGGWMTFTDRRGVVTRTEYDTNRRVSQVIEAQSLTEQRTTVTTRPSATSKIVEVKDASGTALQRTTTTYNARTQVQQVDVTDLTVTPNVTRSTLYTYCEQSGVTAGTCPIVGLLLTVNGPRTDVSDILTYTYYQANAIGCIPGITECQYYKGDLWKVTNAQGQVAEYLSYDAGGRPLEVKDPNGVVTDIEYTPRGLVAARKVRGTNNAVETDDLITRIDYQQTGLVWKVTLPDGSHTTYAYDAAQRLTGVTDDAGNKVNYALNAAGDITQEETKDVSDVLVRQISRAYNALGQLETLTDAYSRNTGFTYDANGNLDQTTDALGRIADNNYDPLNRLSRTLQDMGGIAAETKFTYDALDNLVQVNDPKLLNTVYTYNGFSDLKQLASPDTGTTSYIYDSAGNRASQTDARGKVTNYGYDALNRLTSITYPTATSLNTAYTWDTTQAACQTGETFTIGRLAKITDGSGSTTYCYDRFGRIVRKAQTIGSRTLTLRYAWNTTGQLTSTIYPDGAVVDYVYDAQGRVSEIGAKTAAGTRQVLITSVGYHPFGPPSEWRYGSGSGRLLSRTLNDNYQPGVVQDTDTGGLSVGYEFDEVGNLKKLRDGNQAEPPQRIYDYDALNRLTQSQDGTSLSVLQGYTYDKTGNRTGATVSGTTTSYTYPGTSHRLSQVGSFARSYDANGNTTQAAGAVTKNYVYGDHNRMTQYLEGTTVKMNYVYNGRGEQVRKYLGANDTYSMYDESGHWIGDYQPQSGGTTATLQQAIWFGDLPVGVFAGAGASQKLYFVEPDALGTPRVVIDPTRGATGTTVWKWDLAGDAFGTTAPNQDPDGDATQFVFNLRFPGQRYDSASGLNYNYFRDYDAITGRYLESDPIGLDGGITSYSYVGSRPLVWIDRAGLVPNVLEISCVDPVQPVCWVGVVADVATTLIGGAAIIGAASIPGDTEGGRATGPAPYDHFDEQEAVDFVPDPFGGKGQCELLEYMINVLRAQIAWRRTDLNPSSASYQTHLTRIGVLTAALQRLESSYLNICGGKCPV